MSWIEGSESQLIHNANLDFLKMSYLRGKRNLPPLSASKTQIPPDPGLTEDEQRDFLLQLSVLFDSGVPLLSALECLTNSGREAMESVAIGLGLRVQTGSYLSQSMSYYQDTFDDLTLALVRIGEKTGKLHTVLNRLAERNEARASRRKRLINALTYPIGVIIVSVLLVVLLSHYMLPSFLPILENLEVPLPLPTQFLMFFVNSKWLTLSVLIVGLMLIADLTWNLSTDHSKTRGWLLFQSPVIGTTNRLRLFTELCRDLALMLDAGCTLTEALNSVIQSCPDPRVEQALSRVRKDLINGVPLDEALQFQTVFPPMVSSSMEVGIETGNIDQLLMVVADLMDFELESRVDRLIGLIEPLLMIFLGVVIGGILLACFLPIYSLVSSGI